MQPLKYISEQSKSKYEEGLWSEVLRESHHLDPVRRSLLQAEEDT